MRKASGIAGAEEREPYSYRSDPAVPGFADDRPVIVFDGHCVFCSGWAGFVLRHDRAGRYRLLRAQSALGAALYRHYGLDPVDYQTNILLANGRIWLKSEGSIRMTEGLGLPWSLVRVLRLIPRRLRDALYEFVARNRFRIAGRREVCYVPPPGHAERFLG
jgi:predicted DCC family thiol-disulfide oxidoreductase YuxK